jgi:hypothetical protein
MLEPDHAEQRSQPTACVSVANKLHHSVSVACVSVASIVKVAGVSVANQLHAPALPTNGMRQRCQPTAGLI